MDAGIDDEAIEVQPPNVVVVMDRPSLQSNKMLYLEMPSIENLV